MKRLALLASMVLIGCVAEPTTTGADDDSASASTAAQSNVWAVTIDGSSYAQNLPEATVTVCTPGTKACQKIPHILVDTASTGLRVYAAALTVSLPIENDALGHRIGDCAWSYWGYIHMADVQLAGLRANNIPIEVIEPQDANRPSWCGEDNEYDPNRYNGIIGISPTLTDTMATAYFSCGDQGCSQGGIDASLQVANVSANFPTDNNGCVVQFPAIPDVGTSAITGHVIFGVGTRSNNRVPNNIVPIVPDESWGQFEVFANGQIYESALDSGTWSYNVPYLANELCPGDTVRLCPASTTTVPVDLLNETGDVAYLTSIEIANYASYPAGNMAFDNLGTAWPGSNSLMLGLPYFFGRSIYYGYDQRSTPVGTGPWVGVPGTIAQGQWYRIENVALGLSLDDEVLDASGNYSGQAWRIQPQPGGYVRLTNEYKGTGISLDTANDGLYEPQMRATANLSGQLWRITPAGNGTFRLTNEFRGTGSSLEAQPDGSLHMAPNRDVAAQYFSVAPF